MESIEIRKKIAKYLALRNKLQVAANEIFENGRLTILDVATKYGLEHQILSRKINIIEHKKEFYDKKQRFDAARKEVIEGKSTCYGVTNRYQIDRRTIFREVMRARAQENYEYDRKIIGTTGFTYLQEESLLQLLINWAKHESLQGCCSCQLCALEQLLILAYEFAQENNIECSSWDHILRQASIEWLVEFEMRHSDEISNSFDSFVNPFEQIVETNMCRRVANYNF